MDEYIGRETLLTDVCDDQCGKKYSGVCENCRIVALIADTPAADVAPVVRCEDCVHWDDDPDTYGADDGPKGKCMKSFETMCADDYCSYGERKDGGAE